TYVADTLSRFELVTKMLGRAVTDLDAVAQVKDVIARDVADAEVVLEATALGLSGVLEPVDLTLRAHEVVGVAGLLGSGRTELANLLFGVLNHDSGEVRVGSETLKQSSPLESLKRGVALCPEDRKAEGVVGELTIRENIILALQARYGWWR